MEQKDTENKPKSNLKKIIVMAFLGAFVIGSALVYFEPPQFGPMFGVQRPWDLVRTSWSVVTENFGAEIGALGEGRFLEHVQEQAASVSPSLQGDFRESATAFFQDAAQKNFLGLGQLFSLERMDMARRVQDRESSVQEYGQDGSLRTVVARDVAQFDDEKLSYRKVIENDRVVLRENVPDGFSLLHDLPGRMRLDGVNDAFVGLVQNQINVVDYGLSKVDHGKGPVFSPIDLLGVIGAPASLGYNALADLSLALVMKQGFWGYLQNISGLPFDGNKQ